jgi:hypothetical protein
MIFQFYIFTFSFFLEWREWNIWNIIGGYGLVWIYLFIFLKIFFIEV